MEIKKVFDNENVSIRNILNTLYEKLAAIIKNTRHIRIEDAHKLSTDENNLEEEEQHVSIYSKNMIFSWHVM